MKKKSKKKKKAVVTEKPAAVTIENVNNPPALNKYWKILIVFGILVLTILIYSSSLKNGFIYFDDPEQITDNYTIRQFSWDNLVRFFTKAVNFTYMPLAFISYSIDYQIGQLNPFIFHLHNLILHLCNVLLVFWLFRIFTRKFYTAVFITVLFAIHPVSVDGVAALSTRHNLLATLFFLSSLISYTCYITNNKKTRYLVFSMIFFILAGFSKTVSVVLPVILFLWDYYLGRKLNQKLILEKIPFFIVSLLLGILTLVMRIDVVSPYDYTLFDRFIVICASFSGYFYRLIFPVGLSTAYAYPTKDLSYFPFYIYLAPVALALIIFALYKLKVTRKVLIVGLTFFFINIILTHTVILIDNYSSNRYAYLPYLGLFLILADITEQIMNFSGGWKARLKYIWIPVMVIFTAGASFITFDRNFLWKDTITLFDDVIKKQPQLPWVHNNRGIAKYKENDLAGALKDFNRTLELDPNFNLSYYYRGLIKFANNDLKGALEDFDQALYLYIDFMQAYNDRGRVKMELKDYDGAMADFSKALSYDVYFMEAYFNRAVLKNDRGDLKGALADYSHIIYYDPGYTSAYYNRGLIKNDMGDDKGALDDFSMTVQLDPNYTDAFYMLSTVKGRLGDTAGACTDARTAYSRGYQQASELINQYCPQ